ncbi:MAG: hypothetical protein OEY05_13850 [Paracoccaceae bacterium]|nr:hypothetical protein [Paracoccaceae bacterium]
MRQMTIATAALALLVFSARADTVSCENPLITVNAMNSATAELICTAAQRAQTLFADCNIPPLATPIKIDTVTELEPGCAAIYHCGEGRIEVLEPSLMNEGRPADNAFVFLGPEAFFQSIVVHELTHAALDGIPCPFDRCLIAQEYVSYAMQVMSLSEGEKAAFAAHSSYNRQISRDELNEIILFMAPNRFIQKTWAHLSQRDDACEYIGQIIDGNILLDRERF